MNEKRPIQDKDLGQRSLEEALTTSFKLLKWAMIIVVIAMLFSGVFTVGPNENAVIVRFGKIVGTKADRVLGPGLHLAWPYPIDAVKKEAVGEVKSLLVDDLWYRKSIDEQEAAPPGTLSPVADGYTLTADMNILHTTWIIKYKISDIVDYITGVENEEKFLKNLLLGSVIKVSGRISIDDAWSKKVDEFDQLVSAEFNSRVNKIKCGIIIDSVERQQAIYPPQTKEAFRSWQNAEHESEQKIENARSERHNKLNNAAGAEWETILEKIKLLENAEDAGNTEKIAEIRETLKNLLYAAGGEASSYIAEAEAYRVRVVSETQADAKYILDIMEDFKKNPGILDIFIVQLHLETLMEIQKMAREKTIIITDVPEDEELWLNIPRDPKIEREEQRRRDWEVTGETR